MQTDPIADFLTRIRNAAAAKHQRVDVPASKLKSEIARILKEEGYISTYKMVDENKTRKTLRVFLKYTPDRRSVISGLKRISRPGQRRYVGSLEIKPVVGGLGISILTTPRGLMSGRAARKPTAQGGQELMFNVPPVFTETASLATVCPFIKSVTLDVWPSTPGTGVRSERFTIVQSIPAVPPAGTVPPRGKSRGGIGGRLGSSQT